MSKEHSELPQLVANGRAGETVRSMLCFIDLPVRERWRPLKRQHQLQKEEINGKRP